jgi:phosphoribosyl 1,2-cyclic phosphate phosphodiesterase
MREGRFLFLGTGGSAGVPLVGCTCSVCTSTSHYNKRLRPAGLFRMERKCFLLDVGPDFRQQALCHKIKRIDGVLLTHAHFDHIGGIDDLRPFYFMQDSPIPCLLSKETLKEIQTRSPYLVKPLEKNASISVRLDFQRLKQDFGEVLFEGIGWKYVSYFQAGMKVTGYIIGNFAYISDIRTFDEKIFSYLGGVDILVLSALRKSKSQMHFNLDEALAFARKVGAKKTYLTHIGHDLDHAKINRKLPQDVRLGYDGLEITYVY